MKRFNKIPMKSRNAIFLVLAFALAVVNVWNWGGWSQANSRESHVGGSIAAEFRVSDFQIKDLNIPKEQDMAISRDLFYPVFEEDYQSSEEREAIALDHQKNIKKVENEDISTPITQKTPEQLEEEIARSDVANFKYVGYIWRGGQSQALLVNTDKHYYVFPGDKAGSRFVVEKITNDAVSLRDPATSVTARILMSGGSGGSSVKAAQEISDVER